MKAISIRAISVLLLAMLLPIGRAQDKPKKEEKPRAEALGSTPIKVQVVFTEFEGEKKIKSLPYTIYINAPISTELMPGWVKLRIGNRLPVYTGKDQFSYVDVGTSIDARAAHTPEGPFRLALNLDRSSVEGREYVPMQKGPDQGSPDIPVTTFREPVVSQFKSELDLKLREGQTIESTMATEPVSGRVLKVEVSLFLVK